MDLIEAAPHAACRHPWELSRAESLLRLLRRAGVAGGTFADIGAGDLFFSRRFVERIGGRVIAVDTGFEDTRADDPRITRLKDVAGLGAESVDGAFLMDVLEHVEDDRGFLRTVAEKVRPGGLVLVTVPAHQRLFSDHDRFLRHHRRYDRRTLTPVVEQGGLAIEQAFYFYLSLYLARWLGVLGARLAPARRRSPPRGAGAWPFGARSAVTTLLTSILNADFTVGRALTQARIPVPGLSLCMICRKKPAWSSRASTRRSGSGSTRSGARAASPTTPGSTSSS